MHELGLILGPSLERVVAGRDVVDLSGGRLEHGLVDELRLSVHPVMVGSGQVLFRDGQKQALRLAGARTFGTGVVVLTYRPEFPGACVIL